MTPAWAQRQAELLSDCMVSPNVFIPMIDRLSEFIVPYQHALETEAGKRNVHRYLQGLLSHLPGKNAEDIATLVDVERQVLQAFIGTAPWDHRPLIEVLVPQVARRLGQPDGIIAFDPSSFPSAARTRSGSNANGVATGAKSTTARLASSWVMFLMMSMPCSTSGCPCLRSGHMTSNGASNVTYRQKCVTTRATSNVWRCSTRGACTSHTAG